MGSVLVEEGHGPSVRSLEFFPELQVIATHDTTMIMRAQGL